MKQNTLTKLLSGALALATALTVTACGGGNGNAGNAGNDAGDAGGNNQSAAGDLLPGLTGTTLSDYLSGGESVWYLVNGSAASAGKDTEVERIYLLESDGTAWGGEVDDLTLGDLSQMEEADIADLAREAHRETALWGSYFSELSGDDPAYRGEALGAMLFGDYSMMGDLFSTAVGAGGSIDELIAAYSNPDTPDMPQELIDLVRACLDPIAGYCEYLQTNPIDLEVWGLADALTFGDRELIGERVYSDDPAALERTYQLYDEYMAAAEAVSAYVDSYEPDPGQYALSLNTDRTGNAAASLTFAVAVPRISGTTEIASFTCYATAGEAQAVYDASYGGMDVDGGAFLTRLEGSYDFTLEQPGESDLPVDAAPEELFN